MTVEISFHCRSCGEEIEVGEKAAGFLYPESPTHECWGDGMRSMAMTSEDRIVRTDERVEIRVG